MRARKVLSLLTAAAVAWGALLPVAPFAANVAQARAETSTLQLMWQTTIGEGTTLHKYTKSFANEQITVMVTKVDLNNPYVEVKPVYGTKGKLTDRQTVTQMARETGAVAAINADFFNMNKRGAPFGIVMKDKELVSSMGLISYWYSLGLTGDKTAIIDKFGFTGKVTAPTGNSFPLQGVNKEEYNPSDGRKSHQNQLNMYTPSFGQTSLGTISGYKDVVEVLFVDNVAKEVRVNQPGFYIPYNGFVLWGHGTAANYLKQNFPVGSTAVVEYQTTPNSQDWAQAVGGNVLLVDQGRALSSFQADKSITNLNARTAVGNSQDGKTLYMVTVDGPQGVYLDELAKIMAELGSYRAVNFDGGGSTTMSVRMLGDTQANLAIQLKAGAERRVPTGLAVYNTAPPADLAGFVIQGPAELLIGQTGEFTAKAYDKHYQPYAIDPSAIIWDVNRSDTGSFTGNKLTPTRSGQLAFTARSGSVAQQKEVHVISGSEVQQIVVSPSPISIAPGQTLPLDVKIKTTKGQFVQATPLSVEASVSSPIATVNDKLQLVAGDETGSGTLTVVYDGVATSVPFVVGQLEEPWITFDNQVGMHYAATPDSLSAKGSFTAVSDQVFRTKKAAKLVYDFTGAPQGQLRFAYGRIAAQPQQIPGKPTGMGLWVNGDNSRHWLRAEVIDANGKPVYVDLAQEIDWTGWKQVKGYFPANAAYPLQLKGIYIVDRVEDGHQQDKGTLYFDEISLIMPGTAGTAPKGADVAVEVPGNISLGAELDLYYSLERTASFLDSASIKVNSIVPQPLPGYVPADYSFTIKPKDYKEGQDDRISTSPMTLTLVPKKWVAGKGVGLLFVNEVHHTFDQLIGTMNAQGQWVYEVNDYGTYIPYYLDGAGGAAFTDITNHPAKKEIAYMADKGYVKGLTETTFGPEVSLTRAQYVTLLSRVFNWELPATPKLNFKDKVPDYAQGAVQVAISKGLVKGYPDNTFRPDQPVTRAEAAVILDRVMNKKATTNKAISDKKTWPTWASQSITNVVGLGLMDPVNSKFEPNKPTTRAVSVVSLYRIVTK
ncbi:S-layer homology domain-containing protein [Brevibacillus ruminantium]|uniref:S-layer homology domain-containing protein n=1 Tax=Brevibacillus ruminantium TaxID=2950604 RepID=A0ABY4WE20_9BACL|nr:phosphodiester glycosidase family protein [Brevibacillus ruminantium]USG65421.1 S-layer homology domain-containing protein [Brevibacillus ruminantium]